MKTLTEHNTRLYSGSAKAMIESLKLIDGSDFMTVGKKLCYHRSTIQIRLAKLESIYGAKLYTPAKGGGYNGKFTQPASLTDAGRAVLVANQELLA